MHIVDKTKWKRGVWDVETDNASWELDQGFHAVIIRQESVGGLCGYVGVPPAHPWYGTCYDTRIKPTELQLRQTVDMDKLSILSFFAMSFAGEKPEEGIRIDCLMRVHGGITFAGTITEKMRGKPGFWYFGFDCAHAGDYMPGMARYFSDENGIYRTEAYVREEIASLSRQLAIQVHQCPGKNRPTRQLKKLARRGPLPNKTSMSPPTWKQPLPRHAACRQRKKYLMRSGAGIAT